MDQPAAIGGVVARRLLHVEAHARLSPSAAGRWVVCPGSIAMTEVLPDDRNEAAEEGTASHWVASETLLGRGAALGRAVGMGTGSVVAPNGIVITEEMVDAAMVYVASVTRIAPQPHTRSVEHRVYCKRIHPACWGTPDCWHFNPATWELHVWDYKYGFGIVEPEENWQLICYVAGIIEQIRGHYPAGQFDQQLKVVLHIVQPRPYHVLGSDRTWTIMACDLRSCFNRLETAAAEAMGPSPRCLSGSHCQYCRARHACPAAQQAAYNAVDMAYQAVSQPLPPEALGLELRALRQAADAIKHRLTGLEQQAIGLINAGTGIPGWGIEHGQGHAKWKAPADQIFALGDMMGIDLRAPAAAITPAKARDKGLDLSLAAGFIERPSTGIKLVRQDKTLAARVFGGSQ